METRGTKRTAEVIEDSKNDTSNKRQKTSEENETEVKVQDIAHLMRIDSINMTNASGSGHPTSCSSMAELLSTVFFHPSGMKFNPHTPRGFENDKFVLSKGHAAPILYSAWSHAGHVPKEELMNLRKIDNDLEGHPTPRLDFIDVATGSLGQGLNAGVGMAYSMKYFEKVSNKVFCLLGDGEMAEGSNWEAMNFASFYKLDNLVTILDINRLGQSDETSLGHSVDVYEKRFDAFGFHTFVVDGHSVSEIVKALEDSKNITDKPIAILAKTIKGKYFLEKADKQPWHGKPLGGESSPVVENIEKMIQDKNASIIPQTPESEAKEPEHTELAVPECKYNVGDFVATRKAFGECVKLLGDQSNLVVGVDADVKNSTMLQFLKDAHPDQFID
mmetsp:Transcript_34472/g.34105  ORF Transcript_34472/g.34105 Transcript_34472/m.34105 type:complete len:388 (+) Transcript_34472:14-1177(+)